MTVTHGMARGGRHRRRPPTDPQGRWMRTRDPHVLREAIAASHLTYRELGAVAAVSPGFLHDLTAPPGGRARRGGCGHDTAERIARVLRRPVNELFAELGPDDPSTGPLPVAR